MFKHTKTILSIISSILLLSACSSDDSNNSSNSSNVFEGNTTEQNIKKIFESEVDNVIIPSTEALASSAEQAQASIAALEFGSISQEQLNKAANDFLQMRFNYEKTEAIFFGPNSHFDIDADINSWPLDRNRFDETIADTNNLLTSVSGLPSSIVGFHGLEYILYRNGQVRHASDLTEREITFAKALINDLCLRSYQFECGWSSNSNSQYVKALNGAGLKYTSPGGNDYFSYMSSNLNGAQIASAILSGDHGMGGLSDEIANTKLRIPHDRNDSTYIESPFSRKSLEDLTYNLQSIDNMWRGTTEAGKTLDLSFSNYFKTYNPDIAEEVDSCINDCYKALEQISSPFVIHYKDQSVETAIAEFEKLTDALNKANDFIQGQ